MGGRGGGGCKGLLLVSKFVEASLISSGKLPNNKGVFDE